MSRLSRDLYRRKLKKFLAEADDEGFCRLVWAVDAMQTGRAAAASRCLRFNPKTIASLGQPGHAANFSMETLVNELLVTPKNKPPSEGRQRVVDCQSFNAMVAAINILTDLENAEDGIALDGKSVLDQLPRIGHRQFEWQRGVENYVHLYRSMHLFGGPCAAAYFTERYGLSSSDFLLAGFVAYSVLGSDSAFKDDLNVAEVGLTTETLQLALHLLALNHQAARAQAQRLRAGNQHVGYKASVLRRHPCIVFGKERIRAPLRQLVLARVTSGIYYDVVAAGGDVTREIGERFETYCHGLLAPAWSGVEAIPAYKYTLRGQRFDAPDILLRTAGSVRLVIECKAKRMPFGARFGEDPLNDPDASRGFDELAKGVFQIWRFNAHVRAGFVSAEILHPDAMGMVMTLDHWLTMARHRYEELLARAHRLADVARDDIQATDRRPIAFCPIEDLEHALRKASFESFIAAAATAASDEYAGWHFATLHDRIAKASEGVSQTGRETVDARPYAFADHIASLLPWWDLIGE